MSELKRILMFLLLVTCQVILEKRSILSRYTEIHVYAYVGFYTAQEEQPPERTAGGSV